MKQLFSALLIAVPALCFAASPHHVGPECSHWPINIAPGILKSAGMLDPTQLDWTKTRAKLIASEKVGKDLYHQLYDITFHEKSGREIEVITAHDASSDECSASGVQVVYVIARKLYDTPTGAK